MNMVYLFIIFVVVATVISVILEDKGGRAVLFPVILNPNDPIRQTDMWVKAGLNTAIVPEQERESVESMLMKALQGVKSEKESGNKMEDEAGKVQITLNTVAGYTRTKQSAQK